MSKHKIGVLIDRVWIGGVEKIAINEVKALRELGIEAFLLVLRREKVVYFKEELKDLPIIYLDEKLPRLLKLSFKFPFFSFFSFFHLTYPFLIPLFWNKNVDSIVSHGTYTTFTALTLKKFKKIKLILAMWDPISYILEKAYPTGLIHSLGFLFKPVGGFMDKVLIKNSDLVMVGGSAHNNYLEKLGAKNILKNPPAVYPAKELPKKRGDYILAVTAWKRGKKPEYQLELMKSLPQTKLIMAGAWIPESYQEDFKKEIIQEGLENQVELTGEISEEKLKELYLNARVFLQTNDDRGFGLAALEAAANGCPFIIPEGQGVCELFENKTDGFFTKERDSSVILTYLKELLNNERKAYEFGKSAREKVVKNYSWKKHAERILEVL